MNASGIPVGLGIVSWYVPSCETPGNDEIYLDLGSYFACTNAFDHCTLFRRLGPTRTTHTFLFVTMYLTHRMRTFLLSSLNTKSPMTWPTLYLASARNSSVSDYLNEISSTPSNYPLPGTLQQLEGPSDQRILDLILISQ
jgi:hypothetical protein